MKKIKDHYFYKAKSEGYVARSIYKLEEIDKKFHLISKGNFVLDFGCSPGSWIQYVSKKIGKKGFVLGLDIKPVSISLSENMKVLEIDAFETDVDYIKDISKFFDVIFLDLLLNFRYSLIATLVYFVFLLLQVILFFHNIHTCELHF